MHMQVDLSEMEWRIVIACVAKAPIAWEHTNPILGKLEEQLKGKWTVFPPATNTQEVPVAQGEINFKHNG